MAKKIDVTYNGGEVKFAIPYVDATFRELKDDKLIFDVYLSEVKLAVALMEYVVYPWDYLIVTDSSSWVGTTPDNTSEFIDHMYTGVTQYPITLKYINNFGAELEYTITDNRTSRLINSQQDREIFVGAGWLNMGANFVVHLQYNGIDRYIFKDFLSVWGWPLRERKQTIEGLVKKVVTGQYDANSNKIVRLLHVELDASKINNLDGSVKHPITVLRSEFESGDANWAKTVAAFFNSRNPLDPLPPPDPDDPYTPGGNSTTGGGNGTFDNTNDPQDFPDTPTLGAARAGMVTLFNPTVAELGQLASVLWSKNFTDTLTNLFANPMDLIIGLGIVPVVPTIGGRESIKVGLLDCGVEMNTVSEQFRTENLGNLEVKPYYDAALDYSPFTRVSIYLPFIGVRPLNTDEVMGATINVRYNMDLLTGACVAMLGVTRDGVQNILYTFDGNILSPLPLNGQSYAQLIGSTIQAVGAIAGAAATGGAGAIGAAASVANAVANAKPQILRAGTIAGNAGLLAGRTPYLIFEIPRQSAPESANSLMGYPSNMTLNLGAIHGYTEVEYVHLENLSATGPEAEEIEALLKGGVIL